MLYIPINYATGPPEEELDFDDTSISDWLSPDLNSELKIENIPTANVIIFNKQQTGYYRVLYDERSYDILTNYLLDNHTAVHPLNRAQLIDDLGSLSRYGYVDYTVYLSLLEYIGLAESDYSVWGVVNKHLNFLYHKLRSSMEFGRYETFVREVTENHFGEMGLGTDLDLESGSGIVGLLHHQRLNRQYVADLACFSGVETCVNETMEYVEQLVSVLYYLHLVSV